MENFLNHSFLAPPSSPTPPHLQWPLVIYSVSSHPHPKSWIHPCN